MADFRFDIPIEDMDFRCYRREMSYNFACEYIQKVYLNTIPLERIWVKHDKKEYPKTYFGFIDSVDNNLVHIVARYDEESGCICKRV